MFIGLIGVLLAQAAAPADAATIGSVWDFVVKGGILMIPIGACSLLALAVIVERTVSLRRHNVIPPGFPAGVVAALGEHRNLTGALEYCRCSPAPVATIFAAALEHADESSERLERYVEQAGERAIGILRKNLRALAVIAPVATMLGLLGTIFGMITAFQTVAASGEALGRTELLAKGIYEALITTAAGLIVAIPVIIAQHALAARIDRLVREIDSLLVEFVEGRLPKNQRVAPAPAVAVCAPAEEALPAAAAS